jgi:putative endonuclease
MAAIGRGALVAHTGAETADSAETVERMTPAPDAAGALVLVDPWAVYLLTCRGGKCYIGISPRPQERFEAHVAGKGAAFTRANPPETLAAVAWFGNRSAAASMEARLKALARPAKLEWFRTFPATNSSTPATLEEGLASLSLLRP